MPGPRGWGGLHAAARASRPPRTLRFRPRGWWAESSSTAIYSVAPLHGSFAIAGSSGQVPGNGSATHGHAPPRSRRARQHTPTHYCQPRSGSLVDGRDDVLRGGHPARSLRLPDNLKFPSSTPRSLAPARWHSGRHGVQLRFFRSATLIARVEVAVGMLMELRGWDSSSARAHLISAADRADAPGEGGHGPRGPLRPAGRAGRCHPHRSGAGPTLRQ